jgi:catalase
MTPTTDEQQRLFENTARAIREASKEVRDRHIGNCSKADPAYGNGVAKAIAALQQQSHRSLSTENVSIQSREEVVS